MLFKQLLDKYPPLNNFWQKSVEEVEGNQRLRIGFWVILGIALFYVGVLINESRSKLEKDIALAKQREFKAIHLAQESYWSLRARNAQKQFSELKLKFNSASTAGIAKATLQGIMNKYIGESSLEKANARVEDGDSLIEDFPLWSFVVSIDANFDSPKLESFLFKLSQHQHHLAVESINILPGIQRVRMRVKYWFISELEISQVKQELAQLEQELKKSKQSINTDEQTLTEAQKQAIDAGVPDELFN